MATVKAAFGRWEERVDLDERSAVPGGFVFQLADELPPTHIVNGLGEAVILDHVLDAQTLDANRLVLANEAGRELVLVVATAISNSRMNAGDLSPCLLTIARAFFLLGKATLCMGQLL